MSLICSSLLIARALTSLFLLTSFQSIKRGAGAFTTRQHNQHHASIRTSHSVSPVSDGIPANFGQQDDEEDSGSDSVNTESDYENFLQHTRGLSERRNLELEGVLNARDLASVKHSPIQPGKLFRTGRLSEASEKDIEMLMETVGLTTLIDLRSATELKEDQALMRAEVYGTFTNVLWKDRGRTKDGCVRVLKSDECPVKERFWKRSRKDLGLVEDMIVGKEDTGEECDECERLGALRASQIKYNAKHRERLFVPLMNEFKYVKGTLTKLRKRDILRAAAKAPGSVFSRRVRKAIKRPFLKEINGGGLQMLNELLFRYGAPGIRYVLELCADENRHPVAFYCTAGKDRTGAIAAIILALCGVGVDQIVEDYSLSAHVYCDLDDGDAMVGALNQRDLDPTVFLGAPPHVMKETLHEIHDHYGSIEEYCTWIGFGPEKQQKLREVLLE